MKDLSFKIRGISSVWATIKGHSVKGKIYHTQFYYTDPRVRYANPLVLLGDVCDIYTIYNNCGIEEKVSAIICSVKERPCREDEQES
jgi:hypothetical protein